MKKTIGIKQKLTLALIGDQMLRKNIGVIIIPQFYTIYVDFFFLITDT